MATIVSAIFEDSGDAGRFYQWLRDERGAPDAAIIIAGVPPSHPTVEHERGEGTERFALGIGAGAAAGMLLGATAFLIPGLSPAVLAGGGAAALGADTAALTGGAAIGALAGGLTTWLTRWGVHEDRAPDYAEEVESGRIYVGLDLDQTSIGQGDLIDALHEFHGEFMGREALEGEESPTVTHQLIPPGPLDHGDEEARRSAVAATHYAPTVQDELEAGEEEAAPNQALLGRGM
jgi:hypothetical protein